jgi:hypothetical protein
VFVERTAEPALDVEVQGPAGSRGTMAFVVLAQPGFDPVQNVDDGSLRFGGPAREASVVRCSATRDLDRDGVRELFCRAHLGDRRSAGRHGAAADRHHGRRPEPHRDSGGPHDPAARP